MATWAPIAITFLATAWMVATSVIDTTVEQKILAHDQKMKRLREAEDELGLPHYPFGPLSAPFPE